MYISTKTSDVKTRWKNNAEFIRTGANFPNFLSSSSDLIQPQSWGFLSLSLSLTLIPKSKKTMETSLDLRPSLKTSVYARVEGLVSNVDYLEYRHHNFIQKKYDRKRYLPHTRFVLWTVSFRFVQRLKYLLFRVFSHPCIVKNGLAKSTPTILNALMLNLILICGWGTMSCEAGATLLSLHIM